MGSVWNSTWVANDAETLDWLKGKSTGNYIMAWISPCMAVWVFPVNFPSNQSIERSHGCWIGMLGILGLGATKDRLVVIGFALLMTAWKDD